MLQASRRCAVHHDRRGSAVKRQPTAFPSCRSRRFSSDVGPACNKRLRPESLMVSNCARSLSSLHRCPGRVRASFWESIPATCTAGKPKRRQIARWFPCPMCPRGSTPRVQAGCSVTSSCCLKKRARELLCWIRSRVASAELATQVGASQLLAVVDLFGQRGLRPVIIGDRWYACAPFLARMAQVAAQCLLRVKCNRVFYRPAPPRQPRPLGACRKHC